ncbi:MAG: hypothetical protein Q7R52_02095 [archaeon]|nr:hypothetical protein [archaeon]
MKEEIKKLIQKGLTKLMEERLNSLKYFTRNKGEVSEEVNRYFAVENIANQEGIDISEYRSKYNLLIKEFWEIKKHKEERYTR